MHQYRQYALIIMSMVRVVLVNHSAQKCLHVLCAPDITKDEELYFVVGDGNVPFDGYDGQPIIIWDDWRALDLLSHFDRSLVWKLFAINPERISVNVKYGSTSLINAVNIVTCVDPYLKFMEELAGEYTDKRGTNIKRKIAVKLFAVSLSLLKLLLNHCLLLEIADFQKMK